VTPRTGPATGVMRKEAKIKDSVTPGCAVAAVCQPDGAGPHSNMEDLDLISGGCSVAHAELGNSGAARPARADRPAALGSVRHRTPTGGGRPAHFAPQGELGEKSPRSYSVTQ